MYILFIGRIVSAMGSLVWSMITLILSGKLGISATGIATMMILMSVMSVPMSLLGGYLSDHFNRKMVIIVCDFISVGIYFLIGFMPFSFYSVIAFAIAALFQHAEDPAYSSLVADLSGSENREKAYSLTYLGANLGMVLAPTIGGILYKNHLNLMFIINACSILLSTILIALFIKDVKVEHNDNVYEEKLVDKSIISYIFEHKVIFLYFISIFIYEGIYGMYSYLMPLQLEGFYGDLGSVIYGTLSSTNCLVVITCTSLITRLFAKMKDTGKQMMGTLLIVGGLMLFRSFLSIMFMSYVAVIVFTWGEVFSAISTRPYITRRVPVNYRGRMLSIISIVMMVGSSLVTFIVGRIFDGFGSNAAWSFILALGAIGLLVHVLIIGLDKKEYLELYK